MRCRSFFRTFLTSMAVGLLGVSSVASAASRDLEPGVWYLLSLPGEAKGPAGSLFGDAEAFDSSVNVYTFDSLLGEYREVQSTDIIDSTDGFWLLNVSGDESLTLDFAEVVNPPALQGSNVCQSDDGCAEHQLIADGNYNWTLVGTPFQESVSLDRLRIVTSGGDFCEDGCTIEQAKAKSNAAGWAFLHFDTEAQEYLTAGDDGLKPEAGYWFLTYFPPGVESATLLMPVPESELGPEPEPETDTEPQPDLTKANLLFKSGFENDLEVTEFDDGYQRLEGSTLPEPYSGQTFEWTKVLISSWRNRNTDPKETPPNDGIHIIPEPDKGFDARITNETQMVKGPYGNDTMAFYQEIASSTEEYDRYGKGSRPQTPFQINDITEDPDEYYIRFWMKIDGSSMDVKNNWRLIWQYKSDLWNEGNPFEGDPLGYRTGIYIGTKVIDDETGETENYWEVKGDFAPSVPDEYENEFDDANYWKNDDEDNDPEVVPVPRDEWFQVEIYSKVSSGDDGRFWAKINGTLIGSNDGPNIGESNDSMGFMMLWQLYGNSYPAHQWIDDVEIWDGYPFPTDTN